MKRLTATLIALALLVGIGPAGAAKKPPRYYAGRIDSDIILCIEWPELPHPARFAGRIWAGQNNGGEVSVARSTYRARITRGWIVLETDVVGGDAFTGGGDADALRLGGFTFPRTTYTKCRQAANWK